jgi:hypothetical protein
MLTLSRDRPLHVVPPLWIVTISTVSLRPYVFHQLKNRGWRGGWGGIRAAPVEDGSQWTAQSLVGRVFGFGLLLRKSARGSCGEAPRERPGGRGGLLGRNQPHLAGQGGLRRTLTPPHSPTFRQGEFSEVSVLRVLRSSARKGRTSPSPSRAVCGEGKRV